MTQSGLLQSAVQCNEFAYTHQHDNSLSSEIIILSLDCADICRQTAILTGKSMVSAYKSARLYMHTYDRLMSQLAYYDNQSVQLLTDACNKARACCLSIIKQAADDEFARLWPNSVTVCYGIMLPVGA